MTSAGTSPRTVEMTRVDADELGERVLGQVEHGGRFAGLSASSPPRGSDVEHGTRPGLDGWGSAATSLRAVVAHGGHYQVLEAELRDGRRRYPSVTARVPAAFWYEREIHDLFGLVPEGHPRLDPLVFPVSGDAPDRPRPGRADQSGPVTPNTSALAGHVEGEGVFTIPYGPVRSGIFETVEYLVETFGEDIPRVRVRPYLKHRGVRRRFLDLGIEDCLVLAERVEGTMSVAHATALAETLEALAGVEAPACAQYQRLAHAELERVANHLDSILRHCEGAGQAVAYARFGWAKERVLRLQASLCGHRFGRGLVKLGGTSGPPLLSPLQARSTVESIRADLERDLSMLMTTPSFLDRLRRTGIIPGEEATRHGALGPLGRACGVDNDVRRLRPYGAYRHLAAPAATQRADGDALSRQWVRVEEIGASLDLAGAALASLERERSDVWSRPLEVPDGAAISAVESPQGELLYALDVEEGRVARLHVRTASLHNFALFSSAFRGDIFTDFVFIEASFSVNLAGVAG
ncbi:MAG: NADH-quinone oxidoreductase subunit C [Acidimicrobiales bacterium]